VLYDFPSPPETVHTSCRSIVTGSICRFACGFMKVETRVPDVTYNCKEHHITIIVDNWREIVVATDNFPVR
jgi:hypothetical protein